MQTCIKTVLLLYPSYFWFRESFFSLMTPQMKILLRVLLICPIILHTCINIFGFMIIIVNLAIAFRTSLSCMSEGGENSSKISEVRTTFQKLIEFQKTLLKYRQLQIINTVLNQVFFYIIPMSLLIPFVFAVGMSYALTKLMGRVPFSITFLAATMISTIVSAAHFVLPVFADIFLKSAKFMRLDKISNHQMRQLRSCRKLRISVASFYFIDEDSRGNFLSHLLDITVQFLISV